jgi:hypothetical protein
MLTFLDHAIYNNRLSLIMPPVASKNNNYLPNLRQVSNRDDKPYTNKAEKNCDHLVDLYPSALMFATGESLPVTFKQLFVDHCLRDFFSLCQGNADKTYDNFINTDAEEIWVRESITLYACSNYIVKYYIETCSMQKQSNVKKFHKHIKALSNLMVGDSFDRSSKFIVDIDGSHKNHPPLSTLLNKIGGDIVKIFNGCHGPSDDIINLILLNHSILNVKGKDKVIVVNHSWDGDIKHLQHIDNERGKTRQRSSSSTSYTEEQLIRVIGTRTKYQCLNIKGNNSQ